MTKGYRIFPEHGYVRVSYVGKTRYEVANEMLHELIHICEKTNSKQVLLDLCDADYGDAYATSIQHVKDAPAMGYDTSYRVAILGAEEDSGMLQYIEDVAVNRGFQVRAFVDEFEALEWLRGPATRSGRAVSARRPAGG